MTDFDRNYSMTIGGKSVSAKGQIDVINPATGEVFAQAPDCSREQLDDAVASARLAFKAWKLRPIEERADLLAKAGDIILQHSAELARLFTKEQGRPTEGAAAEIMMSGQWLKMVSQMRPPVHISEDSDAQFIETRYVPLGVVCAIAPWNFPVNLAIWKVAPALLAGNTMVLKPSPFTPLCTLKIGELLQDILPPGVLNVISGGDELGPWMTSHPGFAKISFTGSTETGKKVMESAARDLKALTLELGGNDAAIVLPDVDVDEVAQKIFFGAFANTSQICVATKRLYVHESVYDALRDRVVQEEAFGPVLPMLKFSDIDDVIDRANDSEYGLAGAVWSKNTDAAMKIARKMETGTVWINQNLNLRPDTPFGGHKASGFGVENGMEGLLEFMAPQAVYVAKH